jgi:hypothetical protein
MSIQRGFYGLCVAFLCAVLAGTALAHDHRPERSEEALISKFVQSDQALTLNNAVREVRIPFSIAPNAAPAGIELLMNASPAGNTASGRIEAFVNRSRAVVLQPRAEPFEARFALYSDDLRAGENVLVLRLTGEAGAGWTINTDTSRLRVSAAPAEGYAALDEIEAALAANFAAPRRVHIDAAAAGRDELAVAALIAQGLALRMGEAPILVRDREVAELTITTQTRPGASAPAIDLVGPSELRLSAGLEGSLIAAARLFAARTMDSHDVRFDMTSALSAPRLVRARSNQSGAGRLEALAAFGAPFGSEQGGRAAVVIAGDTADELSASLAVVSRAALASGSAWLYAWYGDDASQAPANHDLLVLGPQAALDPRLLAAAPAEVRAAANAAANRTPRERRFYGSTAFAADGADRDAMITGVAALCEDSAGRRVALITCPEGADYARAAKRLARSGLWTSLQGQAALWDAAQVTPFGPSNAPRFSTEWASQFVRANDEWFALGAFGLAVLLLLLGNRVNRASRREA